MKITETIRAARELPNQIKWTFNLAVTALVVAFIAISMSIVGAYRAH